MHGRFFGGRQVIAGIFDGKRRFRKSGHGIEAGEEDGKSEAQRLEDVSISCYLNPKQEFIVTLRTVCQLAGE